MSGISPQKPVSIWKRPKKVDFKKLGVAIGKGSIAGATFNWPGVGSSLVDLLSSLGIKENDIASKAWILVQSSLLDAIISLSEENRREFKLSQQRLDDLCFCLDRVIEESDLSLTPDFFKNPKDLEVLEQLKIPFIEWSCGNGVSEQDATSLSERLPRYFVFALRDQWRSNPVEYASLEAALSGPFEVASDREHSWQRYEAWLQREVDKPMFAESFGLRQIYQPLRGYFEIREKGEQDDDYRGFEGGRQKVVRHVVDLEDCLLRWLEKRDREDMIRVICGGPGSGKSSFCKILASRLSEDTGLSVLLIPLHQFDPSGDLNTALNHFIQADIEKILPPNPLDRQNATSQVLVIFDGLDELSMQGEVASQVAQDFVREVQKKLLGFNQSKARVFVLLSGRDLVVQSNRTEFRREEQILHLLPYFLTPEELSKTQYKDPQNLLEADQRQNWWQTYGGLKQKEYGGLPDELNRGRLIEITSQPLLNYLVALSYDRDLEDPDRLDFSSESNLNAVYRDLLKQVYKRDWAGYQHPTLGGVEPENFERILEEIAVSCWHGNGRTTTVACIEARCANHAHLSDIFNLFKSSASDGVTRLLTAFYFRQSGVQGAEATFEFTHKSFGEYLAARRIIRELKVILKQLKQHRDDPDIGLDQKGCLTRWVMLCGLKPIDPYLMSFIQDEVQLNSRDVVKEWQDLLCDLINYYLKNEMPMDELNPRPSFVEENKQARNASEALLVLLSSCVAVTLDCPGIVWPARQSFRMWLSKLWSDAEWNEAPIALRCLSYFNLSAQNLDGARLDGARLFRASLDGARLDGARLFRANLDGARLDGARLFRARLDGARLDGASLFRASLDGARLDGASLFRANLDGARLDGARLDGASLDGASLDGASLDGASLDGASLDGAILVGASLDGAILVGASLDGAILVGASLDRASLVGAKVTSKDSEGNESQADFRGAGGLTNKQKAYLKAHGALL